MNETDEILDGELVEQLATETIPARTKIVEQGTTALMTLEALRDDSLNEPHRALRAFRDYIGLGKGRTLEALAEEYCKPDYPDWTENKESIWRMLKDYSRKYKWQERLRKVVARASAEVLANAQREAFVNTKQRIEAAHQAYETGLLIIEKAQLEDLMPDEARRLLKSAATLVHLGLTNERAEQGDMLAVIRPDKPVKEMSDEELDQFAMTLQKALQ